MDCCSFLHYSQPQILEDTEGISLSVTRSQEHVCRTIIMPDIPDGLYICTTERKMRFRVYNAEAHPLILSFLKSRMLSYTNFGHTHKHTPHSEAPQE